MGLYDESLADAKALKELATQNAKELLNEQFKGQLEEAVNNILKESSHSKEDDDYKDKKDKMEEGDYVDDGKNAAPANKTDQPGEDPTKATKKGEKNEAATKEGYADGKGSDVGGQDADMKDTPKTKKNIKEEEVSLEAVIETLDKELKDGRDKKDKDDKDSMDEKLDSSEIGRGDNKEPASHAKSQSTEDPQGTKFFEGVDIETIVKEALAEIMNEAGADYDMGVEDDDEDDDDMKMEKKSKKKMKEMADTISALESQLQEAKDENKAVKEQLEEAESVIGRLSNTITEANLMNSKLLYVNKLNNEFDLQESQKELILNKLQEAENVREAKLIYSTLQEHFTSASPKKDSGKKQISESIASDIAAGGTAPTKSDVIFTDDMSMKDLWQKRAGITKMN